MFNRTLSKNDPMSGKFLKKPAQQEKAGAPDHAAD
jgi:hypothetical protein